MNRTRVNFANSAGWNESPPNANHRRAPPAFLPYDKKSEGILFFDELNAAPPLVQASLYQLTLDRRLGEYELPDKWRILAAGNRAEDASVVFKMPAALSNRFIHLDFEHNIIDWRNWAIDSKIHPLIIPSEEDCFSKYE